MTRLAHALALWLAMIGPASAQAPIGVRADASLAPLLPSIATGLLRRTGRALATGDVLDDPTPRDLGRDVIGLARGTDRIVIFAMAASGALHVTELGACADDRTTVRVIVVALAGFVERWEADVAIAAAPPPPPIATREAPMDGSALEDLAPPRPPTDDRPRFALELRERVAYDTQRDAGHVESGLSIGACFGTWWCLQLALDAMAPEEAHALGDGTLSYEATTIGVGGRFLPLEAGPVRAGIGVDALTRIGHVGTDAPPANDTTVSAAMRLMADVAIQLGGPVSIALEAGADIAFNAIRYVRAARFVFAEDVMTLWGALALRFVVGP